MMAKLSIRCFDIICFNVSLDNRVSFSSALSQSRRLFLRSLSLIYALWPRPFQTRDNFSSPAKTVRHTSLCLYLGVWIIVSPRFLKRDASSCLAHAQVTRIRMLQFYARVVVELELQRLLQL